MIIPTWFLFGLGAACMSVGMMLSQERLKLSGYAAAFWGKAACVILMAPFVMVYGSPTDPLFYFYLGVSAVMFAVSDVIFYSGITKTNAGAVARTLPSSVIFSFLLWFLFDPALLDKYLHSPVIFAAIFAVLCLSAFFAMRLKKCAFSVQAFKAVWFVVFSAVAGTLLGKAVTLHAAPGLGPYAYVFWQGLMMIVLWLFYMAIWKPEGTERLFRADVWRKGLCIGAFGMGSTLLGVMAYYNTDNPAYIPAIRYLDSVIILGVYKATGRKVEGDWVSGLGVVACAAMLALLKAQVH